MLTTAEAMRYLDQLSVLPHGRWSKVTSMSIMVQFGSIMIDTGKHNGKSFRA